MIAGTGRQMHLDIATCTANDSPYQLKAMSSNIDRLITLKALLHAAIKKDMEYTHGGANNATLRHAEKTGQIGIRVYRLIAPKVRK